MDSTEIISTWINPTHWIDGWRLLHGTDEVARPSVWLVDPANTHLRLASQYSETLSDEERAHAQRFHQAVHEVRYKTTHTALRMLLARAVQSSPAAIRFANAYHNKPILATPSDHPIAFNLSYTENKSMIGLANGDAVGIDIEWSRRPIAMDDMLTACFSPEEIKFITARKDDMRHRFFTLWTRKEAILKLTGEGIGEHLPYFDVLDGTCVTKKRTIGGNPPDKIYLYSFRIDDDYLGCFAVPGPLDGLSFFRL